jgi:hypothetical protein
MVWPTKDGKIVELRLQVLRTFFSTGLVHFFDPLQQLREQHTGLS